MAELPILTSRSLIINLPVHLTWTLVASTRRRNNGSSSITEIRVLQIQRVKRGDAGAFKGQFNCDVIALSDENLVRNVSSVTMETFTFY